MIRETPSDDLQRLVERIEGAKSDDPEMFWEAFAAVHGPKPERIHGGSKELDDYLAKSNPFFFMLKARAFLDAAMTLIPNDCGFVMHSPIGKPPSVALQFGNEDHPAPKTVDGWGDYSTSATPALAMTSAALRARITQEQRNDPSSNG